MGMSLGDKKESWVNANYDLLVVLEEYQVIIKVITGVFLWGL